MTNSHKSVVFALTTIVCWSTVASAFKMALSYSSISQTLFIATLTSFIVFGLLAAYNGFRSVFKQTFKELLLSAVMGFLNPFCYYLILFNAYKLLPAQVAQPLNQIWPLVLAILAVPILKQKLPKKTALCLTICFAGVALISSQGKLSVFESSNPLGVGLALSSSIIWSVYWLMNVKDKRNVPLKLFTNFGFSLIYIIILANFIPDFSHFNTKGILCGVYIGLFEMGISFLLWLKALEYAKSAAKVGLLVYLVPFLSLFFIHFIVGEDIKLTTVAGIILIVVGILLQEWHNIFNKNLNRE